MPNCSEHCYWCGEDMHYEDGLWMCISPTCFGWRIPNA